MLERLPTLLEASLLGKGERPLGTIADAAVELRSGRILHYLISRVDPRLPGGSRWRLHPERILDQQPGQVFTALRELDDLPLARASVRQTLLRRSRRLRDQVGVETARWRDQFQQAGDQFEEQLEGWLEELPWEDGSRDRRAASSPLADGSGPADLSEPDPLQQDWPPSEDASWRRRDREPDAPPQRQDRYRGRDDQDDPWI